MYKLVTPIINSDVRSLCAQAYPLHPKGCPNFGKKDGCPPAAPLLADIIDLELPVWVIWNAFDFLGHVEKMRTLHPTWSDRQLSCCLYWQPKARKSLEQEISDFLFDQDHGYSWRILRCPEACGVDITGTMASIGVKLEWPPRTIAYQVALAGHAKGAA